jgi:hypothetical protein
MPRDLVQRRIPDHLRTPVRDEGTALALGIAESLIDLGVIGIQSYAGADLQSTFRVSRDQVRNRFEWRLKGLALVSNG